MARASPTSNGDGLGPVQAPNAQRANLDFNSGAPIDVAACSAGDSAFGCRQIIGNVWEWTNSDFVPFGGFSADPYEDYSQPWFNPRKVLRGGSFATSARIARPGYRNFFAPTAMTSSPASAAVHCEAAMGIPTGQADRTFPRGFGLCPCCA